MDNLKIIELNYNRITKDSPAFLVFANRKESYVTSMDVFVSVEELQGYEKIKTLTTFSMHGTLVNDYDDSSYKLDDGGLTITPTNLHDQFASVSRARFFSYDRLICLNGELIAFQNVVTEGNGDVTFTGLARGVYGTSKASHTAGDDVFITLVADNILDNVNLSAFFIKLVPKFLGNSELLSNVDPIEVTATGLARRPRNPGRLVANRVGSNIEVLIYPSTPSINGAGEVFITETDSNPPFSFLGVFLTSYGATVDEAISVDTFTVVNAGAIDITVKSKLNNKTSSGLLVSVGASDGTYYS